MLVPLPHDDLPVRVVDVRPRELAALDEELELRQVRAGEVVRQIGRREPKRAVIRESHHLEYQLIVGVPLRKANALIETNAVSKSRRRADNMGDMTRTDDEGRAWKGSQLQTQIYVNRRPTELEAIIRESADGLDNAEITWHAPMEASRFREPRDAEFLQLAGLEHLRDSLAGFWPKGGPVWDGLASVQSNKGAGVILLEGKSYPDEMKSACRASSQNSRARIEAAITETRHKLKSSGSVEPWLNEYYQLANRLAHLVWLRDQGVSAWLVLACFADDKHHVATTSTDWESAIANAGDSLGVDLAEISGVVHVILGARPRSELVSG